MNYLRLLLAPLTPVYKLIICIRNQVFNQCSNYSIKVPTTVISVGNLTTGGTGKTPVTIYLSETLAQANWHAVIISRGYGGRQTFGPMVVNPDSDPTQTGDEPLMMAQRLGLNRVVVGHKRYHAAKLALALNPKPNLLIMDDGFQHRQLKRNLDLLLLDGIKCWGNGYMLPMGDLREPMSSAARASCLVVTRCRQTNRAKITAWWERWGSGGPIFWIDFAIASIYQIQSQEVIKVDDFKTNLKPLLAFCAIGHSEAFFSDLINVGINLTATKKFRDHQFLTKQHFQQIQDLALATGAQGLICTEKDAVKINAAQTLAMPIWVARQNVIGGELLIKWLTEQLKNIT